MMRKSMKRPRVSRTHLSREADLDLIQLLAGTVQLGNEEDEEDACENGERQKKRM